MPRPGFVLEVDERTPPLLVHSGERFGLRRFPLGSRVVYPPDSLPPVDDHTDADTHRLRGRECFDGTLVRLDVGRTATRDVHLELFAVLRARHDALGERKEIVAHGRRLMRPTWSRRG